MSRRRLPLVSYAGVIVRFMVLAPVLGCLLSMGLVYRENISVSITKYSLTRTKIYCILGSEYWIVERGMAWHRDRKPRASHISHRPTMRRSSGLYQCRDGCTT